VKTSDMNIEIMNKNRIFKKFVLLQKKMSVKLKLQYTYSFCHFL